MSQSRTRKPAAREDDGSPRRDPTAKVIGDSTSSAHPKLNHHHKSRSRIPKNIRYDLENALVGLCDVWFEEIKPHLLRNNIKVHIHGAPAPSTSPDDQPCGALPPGAPGCSHLDPGAAFDRAPQPTASCASCSSMPRTASRARLRKPKMPPFKLLSPLNSLPRSETEEDQVCNIVESPSPPLDTQPPVTRPSRNRKPRHSKLAESPSGTKWRVSRPCRTYSNNTTTQPTSCITRPNPILWATRPTSASPAKKKSVHIDLRGNSVHCYRNNTKKVLLQTKATQTYLTFGNANAILPSCFEAHHKLRPSNSSAKRNNNKEIEKHSQQYEHLSPDRLNTKQTSHSQFDYSSPDRLNTKRMAHSYYDHSSPDQITTKRTSRTQFKHSSPDRLNSKRTSHTKLDSSPDRLNTKRTSLTQYSSPDRLNTNRTSHMKYDSSSPDRLKKRASHSQFDYSSPDRLNTKQTSRTQYILSSPDRLTTNRLSLYDYSSPDRLNTKRTGHTHYDSTSPDRLTTRRTGLKLYDLSPDRLNTKRTSHTQCDSASPDRLSYNRSHSPPVNRNPDYWRLTRQRTWSNTTTSKTKWSSDTYVKGHPAARNHTALSRPPAYPSHTAPALDSYADAPPLFQDDLIDLIGRKHDKLNKTKKSINSRKEEASTIMNLSQHTRKSGLCSQKKVVKPWR